MGWKQLLAEAIEKIEEAFDDSDMPSELWNKLRYELQVIDKIQGIIDEAE